MTGSVLCPLCKKSHSFLLFTVEAVVPDGLGVSDAVKLQCPQCGGVFVWRPSFWQWRAFTRALKMFYENEVLIRVFQIDMESVEDLSDLQLYWRWQEFIRPASVPVEAPTPMFKKEIEDKKRGYRSGRMGGGYL